jgi:ComF family protein
VKSFEDLFILENNMLITEGLVRFLAPHECLVCEKEGSLLCELCSVSEINPVPERCYRCLAKSKDSAVCRKCRPSSPLKFVWVTSEYEGIAKELIRLFKFERAQAAHETVAELMSDTLPFLKPDTIITYIPTATSRQRMRGYDHSRLIAKRLAKLKNVRFRSLLERSGQSRQVGSTRKQRVAQAAEMFRLKEDIAQGREIVIVDDILTTGASLEAAARILKDAGTKQVSAAVFAQKH